MPRSSAVRKRYCGQVSAKIDSPWPRAQRICSTASRPDTCTIRIGTSTSCDERDRAVRGLALDQHRSRVRVPARRRATRGFQAPRQPLDAVGVLRVHHRHRPVAPRDVQHVEDLAVVELQVVVRHVDLERRVARGDQFRQFPLKDVGRRIADDQVERVVDARLPVGAPVIVVDRRAQRMPLHLRRERNDRRRAAARRRTRAGLEVVGHPRRRRHRLVEVAVAVDSAGQHVAPRRVDVARAARQALAQRDDAPVAHADVGPLRVGRGDYESVPDDEVEGAAHVLHLDEPGRVRRRSAAASQQEADQIGAKIGANPGCFWRQSCLAL